jgi:hypothetical protein
MQMVFSANFLESVHNTFNLEALLEDLSNQVASELKDVLDDPQGNRGELHRPM